MLSPRYLLTALALLSPLTGFATPYESHANGYSVCASLTFDSDKNECLRVLSQGWISSAVVPVCLAETFSSDKIGCLEKSMNHDFDPHAVRSCRQMTFSSDKQNCLAAIADHKFEPAALRTCDGMTFSSDKQACIATIADHRFDPTALRICDGMTFSSDKMDCLKQSGQPMRRYRRDRSRTGNANGAAAIILDALDQILRDVILSYDQGSGSVCSVVNSNDRLLGEVSEDRLVEAAQNFARREGSCVVTNVKGIARTRTLIGKNGFILGDRLTGKEAQSLKRRFGFDRCRVMTCELR